MQSMLKRISKIQNIKFLKCIARPYMKVSKKMELMYKQSDKVSTSCELIYRHPQVTKVSFMYHSVNFMTFTSISQIIYMHYKGLLPEIIATSFELGLVLSFIVFVFLLAQKLRSRFPMRIYYNYEDMNNKAIFLGKIPFTLEFFDFPINSIMYVNEDSQFLWQNSKFQYNKRQFFLLEENFKTYNDFYKMLKVKKN